MTARRRKTNKAAGKRATKSLDTLLLTRRTEIGLAVFLTILAIGLHVYRTSQAGGLWRDEVSMLNVARLPSIAGIWSSLRYESFPILPFIGLRFWIAGLGAGETGLRILGALTGIACLAALWLNKRLLGHATAPLISLALFGINASVIRWGDSLRGYGLTSLVVILAYGLIWKVVESAKTRYVALAAAISILCVQSSYQNAFLLFAICSGGILVCLCRCAWRSMLWILIAGGCAALSLVPYRQTIAESRGMTVAAQSPPSSVHILSVFSAAISPEGVLLLIAWGLFGGIAIVAGILRVYPRIKRDSHNGQADRAIFSLTILCLSTLAFLLFLKGTGFKTEPWYYLSLMSVIGISADLLIEQIATSARHRVVLLALVLATGCVSIPAAWKQLGVRQTNMDILAGVLPRHVAPEDYVLVMPWYHGISFRHYYRGVASWGTPPPMEDLYLTRYDLLKEHMSKEDVLRPVFDAIEKALSSGHKVFVVGELPLSGGVPISVPPAPNGPHGWYSGEYTEAWKTQLGHFFFSHITSYVQIRVEIGQPVSTYEEAPLSEFSGWRP